MTPTTDERANEFWFCEQHHRVERYQDVDSTNRIGPFATHDEAARALQTIAEREKQYDAEDEEWND